MQSFIFELVLRCQEHRFTLVFMVMFHCLTITAFLETYILWLHCESHEIHIELASNLFCFSFNLFNSKMLETAHLWIFEHVTLSILKGCPLSSWLKHFFLGTTWLYSKITTDVLKFQWFKWYHEGLKQLMNEWGLISA